MLKRAIFNKISKQFLTPFSPLSTRGFAILNYHFVANLNEDQLAVKPNSLLDLKFIHFISFKIKSRSSLKNELPL